MWPIKFRRDHQRPRHPHHRASVLRRSNDALTELLQRYAEIGSCLHVIPMAKSVALRGDDIHHQ